MTEPHAATFHIGAWTATCLRDTAYWVDAGSMFGPVPRVRWERSVRPDTLHRMALALNCLVLQNGGRTILIDTGIGGYYSDPDAASYGLDRKTSLVKALRAAHIAPGDIDTVIFSHLHTDHAGGALKDVKGKLAPTFPKALHIVQADEWAALDTLNSLTRDWYDATGLRLLRSAVSMELVRGEAEVAPGVVVMLTGGHSAGHQVVMVRGDEGLLACPCDIVPTRHHLDPAWVSSYELLPGVVSEVRETLLATAASEGWTVFLNHETTYPFGTIRRTPDGGYAWNPASA